MPARPDHHPLARRGDAPSASGRLIRPRTVAARSVSETSTRMVRTSEPGADDAPADDRGTRGDSGDRGNAEHDPSQDGSVATEYGLLAVVAATIVSVMLEWATSGGITGLMAAIMARVSSIVGL